MKKFCKIKNVTLAAIMLCGLTLSSGCSDDKEVLPSYTVTVSSSLGGTLTSSANKVEEGDSVIFTLTVQDGYVLEALLINGSEVEVVGNTFTVPSVLRDFKAEAKFAMPNVTVQFDVGESGQPLSDEQRLHGNAFGELPTPINVGKRFMGWKIDGKGDYVNAYTRVEKYGVITLVADYKTLTDKEKTQLQPFSPTTVYHDAAATKYGVVWHTEIMPAASVVQIVEGDTEDFSSARTIPATSEYWLGEYVSSTVVDELEFATEYSVRFGDISADVWSNVYTFTTRNEVIDETKFFYVTDTQETYLVEGHPASSYVGDTYYSYVMKDAMARFNDADFIVNGGDIVNYGGEPIYWRDMLDSVEEYLFNYPTQVIAGNHEDSNWYSAGEVTVSKMFNFNLPEGQNPLKGPYYSFDYGPVHFVQMTTNDVFDNQGYIGDAQIAWLKADMETARANPQVKWLVVTMHEGIYTPSALPTSLASNYHNRELSQQLNPIFDEYDVDLVLKGHHHLYLCTFPLVCDETQTEEINLVKGVSPVTTQTRKVQYDGVEIAEYVYPEGTTDKGTVFFELGTTGHQYSNSSWSWLSFANYENIKDEYKRYRVMLTSGARPDDGLNEGRSMYSYVEADANSLVVRSYMVDVKAQAKNVSLDNGTFLDGFRLTK